MPGVELYFLPHGRSGVALASLGVELRRNEVRDMIAFHDFWVQTPFPALKVTFWSAGACVDAQY